MRALRPPLFASAALVAASALAACSMTGASSAVVALDDSEAISCAPADEQGRAAFGISGIRNASGNDAEVVAAELVDAEGMELIGLELRPYADQDAHLVGLDYDRYRPQAVVLPQSLSGASDYVTLVGVRVPPGSSGSADAIALSFRASDGDGTTQTLIRMEVVPTDAACRLPD